MIMTIAVCFLSLSRCIGSTDANQCIQICMPSVETILNSTSPLVTVLLNTVGTKGTTALVSGLCVMGFSGSAGVVTSVSRLTWAWARDGGLPQYFAHVDKKHRVPVRAVVLNCCIAAVLALLNLGNRTYVALGAITSLSSMAAQASYLIILGCIIYARFTTGIKVEAWNMGRAGLVINIIALVYTIWVLIFLPFPNNLPVTASNMNYSGPVFGLVLIGSISWWFLRAKHTWEGPNREIVDYILKQSE
jgi:choline transport protein